MGSAELCLRFRRWHQCWSWKYGTMRNAVVVSLFLLRMNVDVMQCGCYLPGQVSGYFYVPLRGAEQRRNSPNRRETSRTGPSKGASVIMKPILSSKASSLHDTRQEISALRYRTCFLSKQSPVVVLEVETNNGSNHVIRSLFAGHGCPLVGDLRYGAPRALPDASVALHAWRLHLLEDVIVLNFSQRTFVAPIPTNWPAWFGCREADLLKRESPSLEHPRSDSKQGESP